MAVERGDRVFVPVIFPEFSWFQDFNAAIRNKNTWLARTTKRTIEQMALHGQKGHHVTHLHACLGATQRFQSVSRPYRTPSTRYLGEHGVASQVLRSRVRLQLSQSRCLFLLLAKSSRVYFFFPPRSHKPSPTFRDYLNPRLCLQRRRFPIPPMPNTRMSLCTQSVHSFSFPPRPLRTAPSRFPNMIRFGNRLPLIRIRTPAHKSLLVRNVVSMLLHLVISRARLYEAIRWSDLLRRAPMMRRRPVVVR